MIAPQVMASCPEDMARDISRCFVAPFSCYWLWIGFSNMTIGRFGRRELIIHYSNTTKLGACVCVVRCTPSNKQPRLVKPVVREEMLRGSHGLHPVVKSMWMASQLKRLAEDEDASMSVGQKAPQNIVDALAARNCTICGLYTLASFG